MNNDAPLPEDVPASAPSTLPSRLANLFVSPGEVYAEVKAGPVCHAHWWVPGLLLVLASWCAAALMFSSPGIKQQMADMQDKALQKQFQPQIDSGQMTQAQADQAKASAAKFVGIIQIVGAFAGPVIQAAATPFWGGLILWLGGIWIFKRPFAYMKAVEVVGLTMVILAVGALVKGLLCTAMGTMFASSSPILLVKNYDPTNALHNSLAVLDVFIIWGLVLRAVGLAKLSDISLGKAAAWAVGTWVLLTGGLLTVSWGLQKLGSIMTGQH